MSGAQREGHAAGSECGTSSLPLNLVDPEDLMLKKDVVQEEPRWRRSRTGRTLSPPQIHQKSI